MDQPGWSRLDANPSAALRACLDFPPAEKSKHALTRDKVTAFSCDGFLDFYPVS